MRHRNLKQKQQLPNTNNIKRLLLHRKPKGIRRVSEKYNENDKIIIALHIMTIS